MAFLNKDIYERKQAYAERKMRENRGIENSLTETQKTALEEICRIRHEVHSDPHAASAMFNTSMSESEDVWRCIDTSYENTIKDLISEADLPEWTWEYDSLDGMTDFDWDEDDDDLTEEYADFDSFAEHWVCLYADIINKWNESIEQYLTEIDKANGTSYCPTGLSRK